MNGFFIFIETILVMCDNKKGFILCTCVDELQDNKPIIHNKSSRRNKNLQIEDIQKDIFWILQRSKIRVKTEKKIQQDIQAIEEDEKNGIRYQEMYSMDNLVEDLSKDFFIERLNTINCFDFNYRPEQGDLLSMSYAAIRGYFIVVFYEDSWHDYTFDKFISSNHLKIYEGKLKFI